MKISDKLDFYDHVNVDEAWSDFVKRRDLKKRTHTLSIWVRNSSIAAAIAAVAVVCIAIFSTSNQQDNLTAYNGEDIIPKYVNATVTVGDKTIVLEDGSSIGGLDETVVRDAEGNVLYTNANIEPMTLSVPRGGEYSMTLSDGTHVWLNAESELTFPSCFDGISRTVSIKGEAYVEVAKDSQRPFIMKSGNTQVHVTGTRFNVRNYNVEDELYVTLISGSVIMESSYDGTLFAELKPGKQFRFNKATKEFLVSNADVSEVIAWHNGLFVFDNETVESMASELSRWYDIDIDVESSVATLRYSGELNRSESIEPLLKVLRLTGDLDFIRTNTGIKIIKK